MGRVSRLWRRLGLTQPLIRIWSEEDPDFAMNDHEIKSITINRGSANSVIGQQDHTMEVNTIASRGSRTDRPLHCDLTTYGANRLADLTGADPSIIKPRYFGRIGRQTIDDKGGIWDPSKWHTNVFCSKWQSQLENSDRVGNQISGNTVMYLFDHFMNPEYSNLPYLPTAEFPSPESHYGVMQNDYDLSTAKITYSDFARKYFDDPGFYVQNTRAGADRVLTLAYRWSVALARLDYQVPITRSQAISPATWEQPNENRPRNHRVIWKDSNGHRSAMTGYDVNDVRVPLVDHDIGHIRFYDDYQPLHLNYLSYGAERVDSGYRLPSVTIDLIRLIDSPLPAHRAQARQLLGLEMGDPVFLGGDWYVNTQGVSFASGITEKITGDRWDLELSLTPSIATVGEWSPDIAPMTWEAARIPWNSGNWPWNG